jgi:hypothetical protein
MAVTQETLQDGRDLPTQIDPAICRVYAKRLGAYGIAVYVALATMARHGQCKLAYSTIAQLAGCGRSTAQKMTVRLVELGLVSIEHQTDEAGNPIDSNIYTLLPIPTPRSTRRSAQPRGGVLPDNRGGVTTQHPPVTTQQGGWYDTTGGVLPRNYMSHDPYSDHDLDPPPPPPGGDARGGTDSPPHPAGGGGGGGEDQTNGQEQLTPTEEYLLGEGFSNRWAHQFRHFDLEACQADWQKARAAGTQQGGVVRRWQAKPPTRASPPKAAAGEVLARPQVLPSSTPSREETAAMTRKLLAAKRGQPPDEETRT